MSKRPEGLLLDLDGTIYEEGSAIPGAPGAVEALREGGIALRFVTNTTRVPRRTVAEWLRACGVPARADDIFTPPLAANAWLKDRGYRRVALCLPEHSYEEFPDLTIDETDPEAVVVGDLGAGWSFEVMNRVFHWLLDGAEFLALHRNRYWKTEGRLVLDVGSFVAAFEYATDRTATLVGKPSRALFEAAAHSIGLELDDVAMVGDDLQADVAGAQAAGCQGFLVCTGKFRATELEASEVQPDLVVDSIASLPALLLS